MSPDTVWQGPWRDPDEETEDYPGLFVHDGRYSGGITFGQSRLHVGCAIVWGWDGFEAEYGPLEGGLDAGRWQDFLANLLEARGEFGRLLCVLADVERVEQDRHDQALDEQAPGESVVDVTPGKPDAVVLPPPWWATDDLRQRMVDQLHRCLTALGDESIGSWRAGMAALDTRAAG